MTDESSSTTTIVSSTTITTVATTTIPPTTSTTVTTTTTAPATTTTDPVPSLACADRPSVPIPGEATDLASITGDVDGDGFDDTVTGYMTGGTRSFLHLELASGWATTIRVDQLEGTGTIPGSTPQDLVTMSGDTLIVASTGGVLPGPIFGLFTLLDCSLQPVVVEGAGLPELWVGGGPIHTDWFSCGADGVTMLQLGKDSSENGAPFTTGEAWGYRYQRPFFDPLGDVPLDLDFPVSYEDALGAYPACAR